MGISTIHPVLPCSCTSQLHIGPPTIAIPYNVPYLITGIADASRASLTALLADEQQTPSTVNPELPTSAGATGVPLGCSLPSATSRVCSLALTDWP